jgi:DNA-binding SARP family transcriptional activator
MSTIKFQLFGKFSVHQGTQLLKGLEASKDQELLSYLLVQRERCHPRETLASLLWSDTSTERSKKYLRQALWHLQTALGDRELGGSRFLLVGNDWIQITLKNNLWLDVAAFEQACAITHGTSGRELAKSEAEILKKAVRLYKGDLLEGWYQDWCLCERERLQNLYLAVLDKLLTYSEKHNEYEEGCGYGSTILRYDRARERTHRQLMLLHYKAGDRTGALRQYECCARALEEEFGVKPERATTELYEQIRADCLMQAETGMIQFASLTCASATDVLLHLKRLRLALGTMHNGLEQDIKALEQALEGARPAHTVVKRSS